MFYRKNLSSWKLVARVAAGLLMVGCGLIGLSGLALGYLVAGIGAITSLTGLVGYCPMCANAVSTHVEK